MTPNDSSHAVAVLAARFSLGAPQAEALDAYVELLLGWRGGNVTGLQRRDDVVRTLLGDSLSLLDVDELRGRAGAGWLDLGAGAGIPGIPLAVALPEVHITLLEASAKKCRFLEEAVVAADLEGRASVVCARSERFAAVGQPGREAFSVVLARAVTALPSLVELAAPLLKTGGVLAASKTGKALAVEGEAGLAALPLCGMEPGPVRSLSSSPLDDAVCALFEKTAPTPPRLPRREGVATKRPLVG